MKAKYTKYLQQSKWMIKSQMVQAVRQRQQSCSAPPYRGKAQPVSVKLAYTMQNAGKFRTHPDKGRVGDIDLGFTLGESGWKFDRKVLVRGLARLVIDRVESAIVENVAHDLVGGVASLGSARSNANGDGHFVGSSQRVLAIY